MAGEGRRRGNNGPTVRLRRKPGKVESIVEGKTILR